MAGEILLGVLGSGLLIKRNKYNCKSFGFECFFRLEHGKQMAMVKRGQSESIPLVCIVIYSELEHSQFLYLILSCW